jgi:hypothetical protein
MNSRQESSSRRCFGLRKLPARYAGIVMPLLLVRSASRAIVEST